MRQPDEGLIHQWLDGECTPEESAELERLVATDAAWAAAVAEARGVIAASSRILGALDAVPHARPQARPQEQAADAASQPPALTVSRGRVTRSAWLRAAAGLVLVAGTAYVLREQSREPFAAVTAPQNVDGVMPAAPVPVDAAVAAAAPASTPPQAEPPIASVRTAERSITPLQAEAERGGVAPLLTQELATAPANVAVVDVPAPAPAAARAPLSPPEATGAAAPTALAARPRADDSADARREAFARRLADPESRRALSQVVVTGVTSDAAAGEAASKSTLGILDGCWRVDAPSALIQLLVRPAMRVISGDSLAVTIKATEYAVRREGDRLRGAIAAQRVDCPTP